MCVCEREYFHGSSQLHASSAPIITPSSGPCPPQPRARPGTFSPDCFLKQETHPIPASAGGDGSSLLLFPLFLDPVVPAGGVWGSRRGGGKEEERRRRDGEEEERGGGGERGRKREGEEERRRRGGEEERRGGGEEDRRGADDRPSC